MKLINASQLRNVAAAGLHTWGSVSAGGFSARAIEAIASTISMSNADFIMVLEKISRHPQKSIRAVAYALWFPLPLGQG